MAPVLDRFATVLILDSPTSPLPEVLNDRFPGCGGSHGSGQSAIKLQVPWDRRRGTLHAVAIEPGRDCDSKTSLQSAPLTAGSLGIADRGYFDTAVFDRFHHEEVFWLSRLPFGTSVFSRAGVLIPWLDWLGEQAGPSVAQSLGLGTERQVACRLIAGRVPHEVAHRRRPKLIAEARRKSGRGPTKERLAGCDGTIVVTKVAPDVLTPEEIAVGYGVRWQIELFFRFFKHVLGYRQLLSRHRKGIEIQAYCAIIAGLLTSLWTGRKPTLRTYEMIGLEFGGWASLEELLEHMRRLKPASV